MKSDEGFSNMLDKQMLNQLVNENVIPLFLNKIQKGQFLLPFFFVCTKIISDEGMMQVSGVFFQLHIKIQRIKSIHGNNWIYIYWYWSY